MQHVHLPCIARRSTRLYSESVNKSLPIIPAIHHFASHQDQHDELTFAMRPWAKSLSRVQDDALRDYKRTLGQPINRALLDGQNRTDPLIKTADTLSEALRGAIFPFTVSAWRAAAAKECQLLRGTPFGATVTSKTFVSTTTQRDIANAIAAPEKRTIINIIIPAGTRGAAYIHPFPDYDQEEFEILLNRGTNLRILRHVPNIVILAANEDDIRDN